MHLEALVVMESVQVCESMASRWPIPFSRARSMSTGRCIKLPRVTPLCRKPGWCNTRRSAQPIKLLLLFERYLRHCMGFANQRLLSKCGVQRLAKNPCSFSGLHASCLACLMGQTMRARGWRLKASLLHMVLRAAFAHKVMTVVSKRSLGAVQVHGIESFTLKLFAFLHYFASLSRPCRVINASPACHEHKWVQQAGSMPQS